MRLLILPLALLLASALGAAPAVAQRPPSPPAQPTLQDDRAEARFRLADSYLRADQPDRAIPLLEDLASDDPASFPIFDRLKDAYLAARRADDAVRLVEQRIAREPSAQLLADLGRIHAGEGRLDEARRAWTRARDAAPDRVQTYRTLYSVMVQTRLWEDARDALLDGRRRLGQDHLFRVELADLHARANEYSEAVAEWAAFLENEDERFAFVQGRMSRLLDQDGAPEAFREAVDRLIRREPTRLPLRRLAAWLAAERGDFDTALDHTRAVDRLGRESGQSLFAFAETARQAEALGPARRAYDLILDAHGDTPAAPLALLASAQAAEQAAATDSTAASEARTRYRRFLDAYAGHANAPLATQQLARLERDAFGDFAAAESLLTTLIDRLPPGEPAARTRFELAELALMQDDLPRARAAFSQVDSDVRTGSLADRARLELVRLDYYEGRFEMAAARAEAMKRNTASDVANDALALELLINEHPGPDAQDTPLRLLAEADLRIRQRRFDDALDSLDRLASSYAGHPASDPATLRRADILRRLDRAPEAAAVLTAHPERFPQSLYADRALFLLAELHERELGDPEAALATYTDFLARHPGSLLIPEVRARLRALRGDRPSI